MLLTYLLLSLLFIRKMSNMFKQHAEGMAGSVSVCQVMKEFQCSVINCVYADKRTVWWHAMYS